VGAAEKAEEERRKKKEEKSPYKKEVEKRERVELTQRYHGGGR